MALENVKYYDKIKASFNDRIVAIDMFSEKCFAKLAYVIITTARENTTHVTVTNMKDTKDCNNTKIADTKKKAVEKVKQNRKCMII